MKITQIYNDGSSHQKEMAEAIKYRCDHLGVDCGRVINLTCIPRDADVVNVWGWRKGKFIYDKYKQDTNKKNIRITKKNILVMERGFIGDRFNNTSLQINGLNGTAIFPHDIDYKNNNKFNRLGLTLPNNIKNNGSYILLIGQMTGDASLDGVNLDNWYAKIAKEASEKFGMKVRFRQHPSEIKKGKGSIKKIVGTEYSNNIDLLEDLKDAYLVITYSSTTCIDAMLSGVPCVAYNKFSMGWGLLPDSIKSFDIHEYNNKKQLYDDLLIKVSNMQFKCEEIRESDILDKYIATLYTL